MATCTQPPHCAPKDLWIGTLTQHRLALEEGQNMAAWMPLSTSLAGQEAGEAAERISQCYLLHCSFHGKQDQL